MKLAAVFLTAFLVSMAAASTATLPNTTSIGYPYQFNAQIDNVTNLQPCVLSAIDKFGTKTKVWNLDGNGFPIFTDRNGFLNTFVRSDDSFVNGETYNFTLSCASFSSTQPVYFETPGTSTINIFFLNTLDWINGNPLGTALAAVVILVILGLGAIALRALFGKKTMWG